MSPKTITIAQLGFLLFAALVILVFRDWPATRPGLIFVLSAIAGTNVFAYAHHRAGGSEPTTKDKLIIGASFAVCVLITTILCTAAGVPFSLPEVTVPISMLGSAIFPLVLTKTAWKALTGKTKGGATKGGSAS